MKRRTRPFFAALLVLALFTATACAPTAAPQPVNEPEVTLRVGGSWADCRALEWAASAFKEKYPNCTVVYEFLQGEYAPTLKERMLAEGDQRIDLFFTTTNIQTGHALEDAALDLMQCPELDLSGTFPSLVDNFKYIEPDGSPATKLYSVPLGAQMRGLYVNVSLLRSVWIDKVPANQAELLQACATLKEAGCIPFHGDPNNFAQQLLYPWVCNQIANAEDPEEAYRLVNTRDPEAIWLFRDIYEFLYTVMENGYYDYSYSQGVLDLCRDTSSAGYSRSLLNVLSVKDANGQNTGEYAKREGVGQIAFLPSTISMKPTLDALKEDYHSDIEIVFIPAPVGPDGGFVYLSPADAIGVNKDTEKREWALRFLNFLFTPENNEVFTEIFSIMPNTKEAFAYIAGLYDVPPDHISELGQATFDWGFYRTLTRNTGDEIMALPAISRANDPTRLDPDTNAPYPFEYYWEQFRREFSGEE